jgi:uncharacterized protein YeeX (DUF496 family)
MKKIYLLLFAGMRCSALLAQAYITEVDKGKTPQAGAAIRLPYSSDQVEEALKTYWSGKGYSPSHSRGYIVYRGVPLGGDGADLYFSTSSADRRQKALTVLSVVPAKKNQDIGTGSFTDTTRLDAARIFLDSLAPFVDTYGTGVQVNGQQEALQKAQRRMTGLRADSTDLEKRLRDLQSDLAQNKADQVKAAADLQTYIGADDNTKSKYQKRLNNLIDKQGTLEKKIRRTQDDLVDKKSDMTKQQAVVTQQQQGLDAVKARQN